MEIDISTSLHLIDGPVIGKTARVKKAFEGVYALAPDDAGDAIFWVALVPARTNVNLIELVPIVQSLGPVAVHRAVAYALMRTAAGSHTRSSQVSRAYLVLAAGDHQTSLGNAC